MAVTIGEVRRGCCNDPLRPQGIAEHVPSPQPPRLAGQAVRPLQAQVLNQRRCLGDGAGTEVERSADGNGRETDPRREAVDELVLLGRAQTDPHDIGVRRPHAFHRPVELVCGCRSERRRIAAGDLEPLQTRPQTAGQQGQYLGSRPVEVVAEAQLSPTVEDPQHQVRAVHAPGHGGDAEAPGQPHEWHPVGQVQVVGVQRRGERGVLTGQRERVGIAEMHGHGGACLRPGHDALGRFLQRDRVDSHPAAVVGDVGPTRAVVHHVTDPGGSVMWPEPGCDQAAASSAACT